MKEIKALQTAVGVVANPSYSYLGWTTNVYLTFSSLSYATTPTISSITFYPHGLVGATGLTLGTPQIISIAPLTLLVPVTVPSTAVTGLYDIYVTIDGVSMSSASAFAVYSSPYTPTETGMTEMITAIMPIFILMMLMMMMRPMMSGVAK